MALTPDYDDDPGRWSSWRPKQDVQDVIASELEGPVLDVGCGEGRLAAALAIVETVFSSVDADRWDEKLYALETRDEVRAFCRHNFIPVERADAVDVPLWLTKRGVLVRAQKTEEAMV